MTENDQPTRVRVTQEVGGQGNQVAGRDFYNQVQEYSPPTDSPDLQPCKICKWPISAINPGVCGKCSHNYPLERAFAAERERKQYLLRGQCLILAIGAVVLVAATTSNRTSLDFLDAMAVCGVAAVAAWGGWCWLRAWCSVKWKGLKRRWNGEAH